ncbi:ribonuclease HI [Anseongella ginsenosidimutans]|uniref:Ribonuclease HI n=2 Tax=Anseongella ginsenosidimutans TaxID=496056 RepID=A0A4R3KP63_9SPHI|nr:ribonuclease HI [Anseongella ginsenosidimutans]
MELLAVIAGLEALKKENQTVLVYSDSKYVVDAVEKGWLRSWLRIDFKGKKNADLWKRFVGIYSKHNVRFKWIRGHAGHPENERCDQLAVAAACSASLLIDRGFEAGLAGGN